MTNKNYRMKRKNNGKGWKIALSVIFSLLVLSAAGACIYCFLDNDIKKDLGIADSTSLAVTIDGKTYEEDASGLFLASGVHITVEDTGEPCYMQILRPDADFSVTIDGKETEWNALPMDFTAGFSVQQAEDGFLLEFPSLEMIIGIVTEADEVKVNETPQTDLVTILFTSGKKSRRISFAIIDDIEVTPKFEVDIMPPHIIF